MSHVSSTSICYKHNNKQQQLLLRCRAPANYVCDQFECVFARLVCVCVCVIYARCEWLSTCPSSISSLGQLNVCLWVCVRCVWLSSCKRKRYDRIIFTQHTKMFQKRLRYISYTITIRNYLTIANYCMRLLHAKLLHAPKNTHASYYRNWTTDYRDLSISGTRLPQPPPPPSSSARHSNIAIVTHFIFSKVLTIRGHALSKHLSGIRPEPERLPMCSCLCVVSIYSIMLARELMGLFCMYSWWFQNTRHTSNTLRIHRIHANKRTHYALGLIFKHKHDQEATMRDFQNDLTERQSMPIQKNIRTLITHRENDSNIDI